MLNWKKYPENRELIFGYAGILGAVITSVYTAYSAYKSALAFDISATIISLCILNACLVISSMAVTRRYFILQERYNPLYRQSESYKALNNAIAVGFHNINNESKSVINKIQSNVLSEDYTVNHDLTMKTYFQYLLSNVKEIFDVLSGSQCSVCIKEIIGHEDSDQISVATAFRDNISYRNRRHIDNTLKSYSYKSNRAFSLIIDNFSTHPYFLCNDLANDTHYINTNPNWKEHYNACLVVPITTALVGSQKAIVSFLCVDNKDGGFNSMGKDILSAIADLNFLVYKEYETYSTKRAQKQQQLNNQKHDTASQGN